MVIVPMRIGFPFSDPIKKYVNGDQVGKRTKKVMNTGYEDLTITCNSDFYMEALVVSDHSNSSYVC